MMTVIKLAAGASILMLLGAMPATSWAGMPEPAPAAKCPKFDAPTVRGRLASKKIDEASGIAASHRNKGVFYVHNDSGDRPRFYAIDENGRDLGRYLLLDIVPNDWEDMVVGGAADQAGRFIYIGDIGDNDRERTTVDIIRIPEPLVDVQREVGLQKLTGAVVLTVQFPGGSAHNSETLLLDPETHDLYIITKVRRGESKIFRYPAPHDPTKVIVLEEVGRARFGTNAKAGRNQLTGGDIAPEGSRIILRTYSQVLMWQRKPGNTIAATLSEPACLVLDHFEPQGEAIAWTRDGSTFVTVSEGAYPPLFFSAQRP
jgi:hypothetical protein